MMVCWRAGSLSTELCTVCRYDKPLLWSMSCGGLLSLAAHTQLFRSGLAGGGKAVRRISSVGPSGGMEGQGILDRVAELVRRERLISDK